MPFVEVSPSRSKLFYKLHGDAAAPHRIIFTMGLGGTHNQWEPQTKYFTGFPDCQTCVYDNRGMGFSEGVAGRWTTTLMAQDALALLDHLEWKSDVHVVGLSMGGMVTQELVLADLGRFASMSLLSTISGGPRSLGLFLLKVPTGVYRVARIFTARDPKVSIKNGMEVLYPRSFLDQTSLDPESGKEVSNFKLYSKALIKRGVADRESGMPRLNFSSVVKQGLAVVTHNVGQDGLARINGRLGDAMTVVTGDEDILVHPFNSQILCQSLTNARLVILPGSGHGANEQCADRVNQEIYNNILRGAVRSQVSSRL